MMEAMVQIRAALFRQASSSQFAGLVVVHWMFVKAPICRIRSNPVTNPAGSWGEIT